jgi:hypothetical protein
MNWALRRRLFVLLFILVVIALPTSFYIIKQRSQIVSTCTDGIKNGDESNIDCGGSCVLMCMETQLPLQIQWTKPVRVADGVYHVVSLIDNQNRSMVNRLSYKIALYDKNNILISEKTGVTVVPPNQQFSIVEYGVQTGVRVPQFAFITLDTPAAWLRAPEVLNRQIVSVIEPVWSEKNGSMQLNAKLVNNERIRIDDITVLALGYDTAENVIAVSSTVVPKIMGDQTADIVFTWPTIITPARTQFVVQVNPFMQTIIELLQNPQFHKES